jgi:hypothetical protein
LFLHSLDTFLYHRTDTLSKGVEISHLAYSGIARLADVSRCYLCYTVNRPQQSTLPTALGGDDIVKYPHPDLEAAPGTELAWQAIVDRV